jgi:hypothetical protein
VASVVRRQLCFGTAVNVPTDTNGWYQRKKKTLNNNDRPFSMHLCVESQRSKVEGLTFMSYLVDPYVVIVDWAECKIETRCAFLICEHTREGTVKNGILDQEESTGIFLDLVARCTYLERRSAKT